MAQPEQKQGKKPQYTKEQTAQYIKDQQERKIKLAGERDTAVVKTETREAVELSRFVTTLDIHMKKVRMNAYGRGSKITSELVKELADNNIIITNLINHTLCKTSKITNTPYKPPRGFADVTKQSQRENYLAELNEAIEVLTAKKEQVEKLIEADKKRLEAEQAVAAAKKQAKAETAKAPKKAKADADAGFSAAA